MHKDGLFVRQLIVKVRQGSDFAFSELLSLYEPLFVSMISKYSSEYDASDDKDDVHQDLRLAFYNAVLKYDIEQTSVDFGLYAKVCLKNALVSRFRSRGGKGVEILPIDDIAGLYSNDDPGRALLESESAFAVQKLLDDSLSEYEKEVFCRYMDGSSPGQISSELGRDAKSISNALSRIRAKLRAAIGENKHNI